MLLLDRLMSSNKHLQFSDVCSNLGMHNTTSAAEKIHTARSCCLHRLNVHVRNRVPHCTIEKTDIEWRRIQRPNPNLVNVVVEVAFVVLPIRRRSYIAVTISKTEYCSRFLKFS